MNRRSFLNTSMLATSGARVAAWLANPWNSQLVSRRHQSLRPSIS
jgi:hypothetical protein